MPPGSRGPRRMLPFSFRARCQVKRFVLTNRNGPMWPRQPIQLSSTFPPGREYIRTRPGKRLAGYFFLHTTHKVWAVRADLISHSSQPELFKTFTALLKKKNGEYDSTGFSSPTMSSFGQPGLTVFSLKVGHPHTMPILGWTFFFLKANVRVDSGR